LQQNDTKTSNSKCASHKRCKETNNFVDELRFPPKTLKDVIATKSKGQIIAQRMCVTKMGIMGINNTVARMLSNREEESDGGKILATGPLSPRRPSDAPVKWGYLRSRKIAGTVL
jgi:hypothetical protein